MQSIKPIFLVGAERSGTTLLRLMLDHHPQLAWNGEFEYAVNCIPDNGGWPALNDYYKFLEADRIFGEQEFTINKNLSYPELIKSFLLQKQGQKTLVGATVHRHFDKLLKIWPEARFIHICRDPRDVAYSCINMGWAGNVWTGVERWIEAENLWTKLKQSLPEDRRIEVTYEQLISNYIDTLKRLCAFIGVPYDESMLSYSQTSTYDLPDPRFVSSWRRKMSDYEVQLIESRTSKMLVERGYELSGLPPLTVTSNTQLILRLQDRWKRLSFRVKRLGFYLLMSDYLSRRVLPIPAWQEHNRQRIHEISRAYLK